MSGGISSILMELAEGAMYKAAMKQAASFIPMAGGGGGGMPQGMDPSMMGGGMDPSMMGGGMPPGMDPSMMGGGMPPMPQGDPMMDPMMMAAQGQAPANIMASHGQPVDPAMASAGGAAPTPTAPPAAEEPKKGGGQREKLDEIHSMLTKILGVLVGKGLLPPSELGGVLGDAGEDAAPAPPPAGGADGGVPAEAKMAADIMTFGAAVNSYDGNLARLPQAQKSAIRNAAARVILAVGN